MAGGNNFDPNDAKQVALEIEKIYKRIGLSNPFKNGTHSLSELKAGLEEARDMMMDWADGIGEIERGFKAILDEVKATSNSFASAKRNLTSLSSISSQIRDHQLGINQLSSKHLASCTHLTAHCLDFSKRHPIHRPHGKDKLESPTGLTLILNNLA